MENVVTLRSGASAGPPQPKYRLIGLIAHAFSFLAIGIALFSGSVLVVAFVPGANLVSMGPGSAYLGPPPHLPGIVPFETLPLPTRLAYGATLVLETVPAVMALVELRALLRLFERGRFFENGCRRRLSRAAAWLGVGAGAPTIGRGAVVLAGHGVDHDWLHASLLLWLVGAAFLLAIGRALRRGDELEHDLGEII